MADWKTHINYNCNPAYLAYAYGHVFQPGQSAGNLGESEVTDLSSNNGVVPQTYYNIAAETQGDSPPRIPGQHVPNGHYHYQSSGLVYIGATQTGRFLLAGPRQADYEDRTLETKRAGRESTSDSEPYISPDSWGSTGSREETLLQTDPTTWIKKNLEKQMSEESPDARKDLSRPLTEELGNGDTTGTQAPLIALKNPSTTSPKAKARKAFSESQMNILVHKFSIQRYLPPAEMKSLAEMTGLTYKQVKTWFQNRRMKLRRHQKDTSWVSERYTTKNGTPAHGKVYNVPPYSTSYQGEDRSQHMMDTSFKNTAPQNVAFYMTTMGPGSTGYPSWMTVPSQTTVPIKTQQRDWPTNPNVGHYDINPHIFTVANEQCAHFESKDGEMVDNSS